MHTSPTNKHYIGITKQQPPSNRWRKDGKGYKNSIYFWNAIQKYGWDNFKHVIVAEGLSLNEASEMEKDLIQKYKTTNKDFGYNISSGGIDAEPVYDREKLAQSRRKKINQYDLDGNYICSWDSLTSAAKGMGGKKSCISAVCRKEIQSAYGYMWSYENVDKLTPRRGWHEYSVSQYDLNCNFIRKYQNLQEVYDKTGFGKSGIAECCNRNRDSSMGYIWRYNDDTPDGIVKPRARKVKCFDTDKNYIKTYDSLRSIGLNSSNIRTAILNNKIAYGHYWEYDDAC